MQNYSKWIVALTLAAPLAVTPAYADPDTNNENHPHETVQMSDLPAPVQKTVQREAKGKTIESLKKETEDGKTIYEVQLVSNGKSQEVEISDTGKVLNRHDTAHGSGSPNK